MASRIELRGDTAANWTTANPVLAAREIAVETDTKRIKIGDGATVWTGLGYVTHPPSALDADMAAAVAPGGSATAAAIAADPAVRAALVPRPTGGTDGQALIKSGASVVWGTVAGGSSSVADNGDGTASTTSSSVTDNGDGTALAA